MIDTHAHLDDRKFDGDRDEVIGKCMKMLRHVFLPASAPGTQQKNMELSKKYAGFLHAMGGMDPMSCLGSPKAMEKSIEWARDNMGGIIAVGEVGLEYHHAPDRKEEQKKNFSAYIGLANELGKPVVVHVREAWPDALDLLGKAETNVIIHCFSGGKAEAKECSDRGFLMSLATNACYPQNANLINFVDVDNMALETDSPYLHPFRQGRNTPANVWETAGLVAKAKGMPLGEVERITDRNALSAFRL